MATNDDGARTELPPQELVAQIFREAGFEVETRVGREPGTVDWFAVARSVLVRPRTYFRAFEEQPEDLDAMLGVLEATRMSTGADRAIGIVMSGALPQGYTPDLAGRSSNVLTFRRWLFEVSGIAVQLRYFALEFERAREHKLYLPRRAWLATEEVAVEAYIDAWAGSGERTALLVEGSGTRAVLMHAVYRSAIRFVADPETTTPHYLVSWADQLPARLALQMKLILPVLGPGDSQPLDGPFLGAAEGASSTGGLDVRVLRLIPPEPEEVARYFEHNIETPLLGARFRQACREIRALRALTARLSNLPPLVEAIRAQPSTDTAASIEGWVASVIVAYVRQIESEPSGPESIRLEDEALRQFAIGGPPPRTPAPRRSWAANHGWFDAEHRTFLNDLLLNYFLARKIVREVQSGNEEILLRYQFPRFVFLFLTIQAPDVAARITGGAVGRMEEKIREEAERIAQLGFAHRLNRPVGAMRQHLGEIRDALDKEQRAELARQFARIEEEIQYLENLAEKTRIWQSGPTGSKESVLLRALVDDEASPLQNRYPGVSVIISVPEALRVLAIPDALHEALHCILENAFHAALCGSQGRAPRVTMSASRTGDVVRIELRDSGDGINPADRDLVFEPFKSLKTGGAGKPRGTGLGLAIARRFVEAMGGRVGLDADQEETCFFIDLVAGKEEA